MHVTAAEPGRAGCGWAPEDAGVQGRGVNSSGRVHATSLISQLIDNASAAVAIPRAPAAEGSD